MVREIVTNEKFLKQPSQPVKPEDIYMADDLRDTLAEHSSHCVGMAANMIGYKKNMIIVSLGMLSMVMVNPQITKKEEPYQTEEGCLSLTGTRRTTRYNKIEVEFYNTGFEKHTQEFSGHVAQIIQHECDHLKGILI
ncbi:MAG: peptide deformylase [Lachnospiraceae bacterium]|nr:peptide deformylase [Lachnospiraceae bacterium]